MSFIKLGKTIESEFERKIRSLVLGTVEIKMLVSQPCGCVKQTDMSFLEQKERSGLKI